MHWATSLVIAWVIEIATVVVLIKGMFFIIKFTNRLEKNLKKSINSILITFVLFVLVSIFMGILVTKEISYESLLWILPPAIGFISAIILNKSGKRLFKEIEKS